MGTRLVPYRLWTSQALSSGGAIVSEAIDCRNSDPEYLMLKATAAGGTASVKIEVAVSNDGTTFNSFTSQDPIIAATATEFASQGEEEYHAIVVPGAPWIKLQVSDVAMLATVVDATLWMRG